MRCYNIPGWIYKVGKKARSHWESTSWLGSRSWVVRALAAQANDLGLIPSDSLPFFLPYIQLGISEHLIHRLSRQKKVGLSPLNPLCMAPLRKVFPVDGVLMNLTWSAPNKVTVAFPNNKNLIVTVTIDTVPLPSPGLGNT